MVRRPFASPAAALNPTLNTGYAAALLREYRRQTGSWAEAVGLYHSHTPAPSIVLGHRLDAGNCISLILATRRSPVQESEMGQQRPVSPDFRLPQDRIALKADFGCSLR